MLEVGCPAVCLDEAAIREEIAPENRTGSQLKKVKKGASPDHTRRIELAFARGGGKQRLSSRDANRSDRSPSPSLTQQASGDG